jgi:hypothetical protein
MKDEVQVDDKIFRGDAAAELTTDDGENELSLDTYSL